MADIQIRKEGRAGRITLTREAQLNALSLEMVEAVRGALAAWAGDPDVGLVILDAAGSRAFCAGGDLAAIHADALGNGGRDTLRFWRKEYAMNLAIARFPKPVVSLMQGYVLGGGVGFGCHAHHRVVSESAAIGMPECQIGLVPDVGGTYLLSRAPGTLGAYLGLTGARMGAADAIHTGFADRFVPEDTWPDLVRALVESGQPHAIAAAACPVTPGPIQMARAMLDNAFAAPDLTTILARLDATPSEIAQKAARAMRRASPLAMAAGLEMIRRARGFDTLEEALALETRGTARALLEGDFVEGIRAQIIDKDQSPTWRHAHPVDVTAAEVAHMLRPFDDPSDEFPEETP